VIGGAFIVAVLVRLASSYLGDIGAKSDGMIRLYYAVRWSEEPIWGGFSGRWPPLHWYALGLLLEVWNEPVAAAKTLNFLLGLASIVALRAAAQPLFGQRVALLAAALLSLSWTHIWLTTSYYVEVAYLLFVLLAVRGAMSAAENESWRSSLLCGASLAVAVLLRHEGMLLVPVFLLWYSLRLHAPGHRAAFIVLPLLAVGLNLLEPWLRGFSYADYFLDISAIKIAESELRETGPTSALLSWMVLPSLWPSFVVSGASLLGLWLNRSRLGGDLFAWIFAAQAGFYLTMTFTLGWPVQQKHVMLYFASLLPHAAMVWLRLIDRFATRKAVLLAALLATTVGVQAFAWGVRINAGQPLGWLPISTQTDAQQALDDWLAEVKERLVGGNLVGVGHYERNAWDLRHAALVNRFPNATIGIREVYAPAIQSTLGGRLPDRIEEADALLIDPGAPYYDTVLRSLSERSRPPLSSQRIHGRISALILSPRAKAALAE
jgi:4-amino-4-deoxy-L-arabinose transferase-like glycosyltransferase